jgi:hypothetical protein
MRIALVVRIQYNNWEESDQGINGLPPGAVAT